MDRDFQSDYESFLANSAAASAGECSSDDISTFNSMFSNVSLLSLLTSTPNQDALLSSLPLLSDFTSLSSSSTTIPPPPGFVFFPNAITPKPEPLPFTDFTDETNHLPRPPQPPVTPTPPFNFMFADTESPAFHHLPDLLSLDHFSPSAAGEEYSPPSSSSLKRLRADSTSTSHHQASPPPPPPPPMVPRGSALARQRRQKLSDKTRCLQKLLPWDKKMDMATMLEEAYKYVKFLQAQLAALQSMPAVASSSSSAGVESFGGLGRLNGNQLLQVLVNSPVAQTTLYSKGCCVFSVEQLGLLERLADMSRITSSVARNSLPPNRF